MEKSSENDAKGKSVSQMSKLKRNRMIFFFLNMLPFMPLAVELFGYATYTEIAAAIVVEAIALLITFFRKKGDTPACAELPILFAFNLLAVLALNYQELIAAFNGGKYFSDFLMSLYNTKKLWIFIAAGIVMFVVGYGDASFTFLSCLGVLAIGIAAVSCADGAEYATDFWTGTVEDILPVLYAAGVWWTVLCQVSASVCPRRARGSGILGLVMLVCLVILLNCFRDFTMSLLVRCMNGFFRLPQTLLSWRDVTVSLMLLVSSAVWTGIDVERKVDAVALTGAAVLVLALRLMLQVGISWQMLSLLLPLAAGVVICVKNEAAGEKVFGLQNVVAILVLSAVLFIAGVAIYIGFWYGVVVAFAVALLLFLLRKSLNVDTEKKLLWAAIVTLCAGEGAAWNIFMAKAPTAALYTGIVYVLAMAVFGISWLKTPTKDPLSKMVNITVCVCGGVLCLLSAICA